MCDCVGCDGEGQGDVGRPVGCGCGRDNVRNMGGDHIGCGCRLRECMGHRGLCGM